MERIQTALKIWLFMVAATLFAGIAVADEASQATGLKFYFPSEFGPNAVGHTTYTIVDAERGNRPLSIDIWYPVREEDVGDAPVTEYIVVPGFAGLPAHIAREGLPPSPRKFRKLVVFSHGSGGISVQSTLLTETLASHGFIVVAPNHTGNTAFGLRDPLDVVAYNRVGDVKFVIDHMMMRNLDLEDIFYQHIDPDDVGVTGHSFGGFTAVGVAAGYEDIAADPRVRAIAPIAGVIENAFTPAELATIDIPVLLLGGTADTTVPIENNDYAFTNLKGEKPVHQIDIIDATHNQFAGICDIGDALIASGFPYKTWPNNPITASLISFYDEACLNAVLPIEEVQRLQSQYVVAFFRRYLTDGNFWNSRIYGLFLHPDWIELNEADSDAWRRSALDPFGLWY